MAASPLNNALSTLDATIESINNKVQLGIDKSQKYRQAIIARLGLVVQELDKLKKNGFFQSVGKLKSDLDMANSELKARTQELVQTKMELNTANNTIETLRKQVDDINSQLKIKNDELQRAQEALTAEQKKSADKDKTIQELNNQIAVLNEQKNEAVRNLTAAQTEINSLIDRLTQINRALIQKIEMIDRITQSLDLDNDTDVLTAFKSISDNIQAIMYMINNPSASGPGLGPGPGPGETARPASKAFDLSLYNKFAKLNIDKQAQIVNQMEEPDRDLVWSWRESALAGDETNQRNIQNMFSRKYPGLISSGGKRRKTMKRRKTPIYKGGYVYSSSKDLDRASSVISYSSKTSSASSESKSKSRRRGSFKKRKETRKHKSNK